MLVSLAPLIMPYPWIFIGSMIPSIILLPVTTKLAIINPSNNDTGDKTVVRILICLHFEVNILVKNILYCTYTKTQLLLIKYGKTFCLKILVIYRQYRWHQWLTFTLKHVCEILYKFEIDSIGYSEPWGSLISDPWKKKNLKILCQTPFNQSAHTEI